MRFTIPHILKWEHRIAVRLLFVLIIVCIALFSFRIRMIHVAAMERKAMIQSYFATQRNVFELQQTSNIEQLDHMVQKAQSTIFTNWYDIAAWLEELREKAIQQNIYLEYTLSNPQPTETKHLHKIITELYLTPPQFGGYSELLSFTKTIFDDTLYQIDLNKMILTSSDSLGVKEESITFTLWLYK